MNGETNMNEGLQPVDDGSGAGALNQTGPMPNGSRARPHTAMSLQESRRSSALDRMPFDPWRLVEALRLRWFWLVAGGCGLAMLGFLFGLTTSHAMFTATVQLVRNEGPNAFQTSEFGEAFRPQPLSEMAFRNLLRSQDLLHRVGAKCSPPLAPKALAERLRLSPDRNVDFISVTLSGNSAQNVAALANLFAEEATQLTKEMQASEAKGIAAYLSKRLQENELDQTNASAQLGLLSRELPKAAVSDADLRQEIKAAQKELVGLLGQYTDAYPRVQEQRAKIAALEKQLAETGNPGTPSTGYAVGNSPTPQTQVGPGKNADELDTLLKRTEARIDAVEKSRSMLQSRAREAQLFAADPPGYYRVLSLVTEDDVVRHGARLKIAILALFGGCFGLVFAACAVLFTEVTDRQIKTSGDLRRVTRLPVLATLGDLDQMSAEQRTDWAFRTWTRLQDKLNHTPGYGVVCGFTSSAHEEGRSTWVKLLGQAASQRGLRVLTVATQPSPPNGNGAGNAGVNTPDGFRDVASAAHGSGEAPVAVATASSSALTHNILSHPEQIAERLIAPDAPPVVHIPLPGWAWDYERRKQWHAALQHWRKLENVVILVELPPASVPEAVLLAEHVPQLVWLSGGNADPVQTRKELETLRHARCNLTGAVLNRETVPVVRKSLLQWMAAIALASALTPFAANAGDPAATNEVRAPEVALSSTAATRHKRAAWQERFTLGPGDVLNFSLFGQKELTRYAITIGPDGRVGYLQAQDIMAAGLTIDELRAKLDEALAAYYRAPRTIVTPVMFNSKKYFLLGSVVQKGVYSLDRPTTIIEAIARARGVETGLQQRNLIDIADMQRAFLARRGERVGVDFEKLFLHGDLTQNVPLEPGDYLYFPPVDTKEVYVLGEVRTPGAVAYAPDTSALRAIVSQGGFTDRAWKKRVLVVRGSLNQPETFVVDAASILSAGAPDFKLEPRDIVYVHYRPWIKAEELVDLAASAFVQAAVITWTGGNIGPLIRTPIIE